MGLDHGEVFVEVTDACAMHELVGDAALLEGLLRQLVRCLSKVMHGAF
jgi:hypothetical protein